MDVEGMKESLRRQSVAMAEGAGGWRKLAARIADVSDHETRALVDQELFDLLEATRAASASLADSMSDCAAAVIARLANATAKRLDRRTGDGGEDARGTEI